MSMTLEEAIKLLKQYQGYEPMSPDGETLKHSFDLTDETVDALLAVLRPVSRERVERIWFREPYTRLETRYGEDGGMVYSAVNTCMACGHETPIGNFCHNCGAAQTREAVEMVMRRLEALHENIHNG